MSKTEKTQERTVRRYANWFVGLTILLTGIVIAAVWMSRTHVPLLLTVATQVVPKGQYYAGPFARDVSSNRGNTLMIAPGRLLGISHMSSQERVSDGSPPTFTEYRMDKTLHTVQTWSAIPPGHPIVKEVKISPTGDRIAWLVDSVYVDPALARLRRLLPFTPTPPRPRQELWISRLDGKEMRVLGQIPETVRNANLLKIGDLRWLPDGKHISFVYDDALWTVPADR